MQSLDQQDGHGQRHGVGDRWSVRLATMIVAAALPLVAVTSGAAVAAVAEPQFGTLRTYPGNTAQSVAIADFTGDGRNDVATSGSFNGHDGSSELAVFVQSAAGTLELRDRLATSHGTEWARETSVAAGDMDGDGRADAAVTTEVGIDVFFQRDGGLGGRVTVDLPGSRQAEVGDVDGDGFADLVANGAAGVSWVRSAGDGTFGTPVLISPAWQVEIEVGDLTGDGRLDVAGFELWGGSIVHVFRQLPGGTFATSDYASNGGGGLAIGDITGDGLQDLAATIPSNGGGVLVLAQRADHTLAPAVSYDGYDIPRSVESADVNGDGRLDVVTIHGVWNRAGVFLQNDDGTLTSERLFAIPYVDPADKGMAVGDVTGDGRPDIVFVQGKVYVLPALAPLPPTSTTTPTPTTVAPGPSTSTTSTTVAPPPTTVAPDESTSFQIDAAHSGRVAGGTERPPLEKRWTRDLGGVVSHPLMAGGKVFALARTANNARGTTLFALDAVTGEDVWGPLDLGSNAWFGYGDGQVFVVNEDGVRRSLDAATGRLRWINRGEASRVDAPPVYRDGLVWYIAGGGKDAGLLGVSAADGRLVKLLYSPSGNAMPAVSADGVYTSLACTPDIAYDTRTFARLWPITGLCSGGSGSTPVVSNGLMWVRTFSGRLPTAVDARTGARVVTFSADTPPAFDGGRGYFLSRGALEARDPRSQSLIWSFTGDGQLRLAPIVVNGFVYVASASGQVWALDGATGDVAWTGDAGAPILASSEFDSESQLIGLAAGQGIVGVPAGNLLVAFGSQGGATGQSATVLEQPVNAAAIPVPAGPPSDEATALRIDATHAGRLDSGRESPPLQKRWTRDFGYPVSYSLLAASRVFLTAGPRLFAVDAETGADAWPPVVLGADDPNARSTVVYGDGRLFAAFAGGPLRAFDATTGAELWSTPFGPTEFLHIPPVYAGGIVYTVSNYAGLRAVSATTGRVLWSNGGGPNSGQPPTISGGRLYLAGVCNSVHVYDAFTGASLWNSPSQCSGGTLMGSAVARGRLWIEGGGFDTPLQFDADTGTLVGAFGGSLPAFDDNHYYVLNGIALKAKDPLSHFTEWTFLGDGLLGTPPVVVDGLVYVGSASGRLWALDPDSGVPVWEGDAGAPIGTRGWTNTFGLGANIAAGQGIVVVPATNTLVAFEPVSPPPPAPVAGPSGWGWNAVGQVGDGSIIDRHAPTTMAGVTDVVQMAAGAYHDLALRADGTVWATGWNGVGQVGDGTRAQRLTPVQVPGLTDVVSISAGGLHSLAVKRDGSVWAWGWNAFGQLGDGSATDRLVPVKVALLGDVVQVSGGLVHTLALKRDGTVWSFGWNAVGQLGNGGTVDQKAPVRVQGLTDAIAVGAGSYHSLAVRRDGTVVAWGWNILGQLGDGTRVERHTPTAVPGVAHVTGVAGGCYHSLAVHDDGTVSAWGWNGLGGLGDGTTTDRLLARRVPDLQGVSEVAAGFYSSMARREDGRVLAWGWNYFGQLGDGTTTDRLAPKLVPGLFEVGSISSGALHSVAA